MLAGVSRSYSRMPANCLLTLNILPLRECLLVTDTSSGGPYHKFPLFWQIKDLTETINAVPADVVVIATPMDLSRLIKINKPTVRVEYVALASSCFHRIAYIQKFAVQDGRIYAM